MQIGAGANTYEWQDSWAGIPDSESAKTGWAHHGVVVSEAGDVISFHQEDRTVLVFDRDGNLLSSWGNGAFLFAHGIYIESDIVYVTDRDSSVCISYTLDGKPIQMLGRHGVHSDTGCEKPADLVPRAAGPFNYPSELVPAPSGDLYVSDGYRNARVHRFSADGRLIASWGEPGNHAPGEFHSPHSLGIDKDGLIYVCDRMNNRIQIFGATGDFLTHWTDVQLPTDLHTGRDGTIYVAERPDNDAPEGWISVRDGKGAQLARWTTPRSHQIWIDSHDDIYLVTGTQRLSRQGGATKYIRMR